MSARVLARPDVLPKRGGADLRLSFTLSDNVGFAESCLLRIAVCSDPQKGVHMSNTQFVETNSTDPVERAIARKVIRLLNDRTLNHQQRESLVKKAQRELREHQKQVQQRQTLGQQIQQLTLPTGYQPRAAVIREGRVQLGALHKGHSFVWLDAGDAPQGIAGNLPSFLLDKPRATRQSKKGWQDPIMARRKELGLLGKGNEPVRSPRNEASVK